MDLEMTTNYLQNHSW